MQLKTEPSIRSLPTASKPVPPPVFHVMLKPSGSICNLDCKYCYFLSKERMYPGSRFRMADDLLESYIRQYIEAQQVQEITFAWQGGEPTLMGLPFFERAVELQQQYAPPGMRIYNAFQTNGVLLDDDWCQFFRQNDFLIGLSIDGPQALHDFYRVDKGGQPTFKRVMRGLDLLQTHSVEYNILTTIHAANAPKPLEVYHFLRDEIKTQYMQFIPIVERDNETGYQEGSGVKDRSVTAAQYGRFLSTIFDEWVRKDVGRVYVQIFDVALAAWSGQPPGLCIFDETCGKALAMEHNGDLFSCDHFVEPKHKLGNIQEIPLIDLVATEQQQQFGLHKRDSLPQYCRDCEVRFVCNGGCPKNRFIETPTGEAGLNYLCAGYRSFFNHIDQPMRFMAHALRTGRPPASVMSYLAQKEAQEAREFQEKFAGTKRNASCPCGSGRKFKQCHGRK
ncbi:MAG: anaerobic sulfatase maturase [Chloroflexota bacterium]